MGNIIDIFICIFRSIATHINYFQMFRWSHFQLVGSPLLGSIRWGIVITSVIISFLFIAACNQVSNGIISEPAFSGNEIHQVKLITNNPGVYQINSKDLGRIGFQLDRNNVYNLGLYLRGKPQPLWIESKNDEYIFRFYASAGNSRYLQGNIYWLRLEEHISEMTSDWQSYKQFDAPDNANPVQWIRTQIDIEDNLLYYPQVTDGDHWFSHSITAPGTVVLDFHLDSDSVVPDPGRLLLSVWGLTESAALMDHRLDIVFNGIKICTDQWDGRGWHWLECDIPSGVINGNQVSFTINAPGIEQVPVDMILINSARLEFTRKVFPINDDLIVLGEGKILTRDLQESLAILDVTNPTEVNLLWVRSDSESPLIQIMSGHVYLASKTTLTPRFVMPVLEPDLRQSFEHADYIAIGTNELLLPIQPLLDLREQMGLRTVSIPVDAIYDQFGYGYPEPDSIREYIKFIFQNWPTVPGFLLLVGDASFDPAGYINSIDANQLPTFFVSTQYGGETASDVPFEYMDDSGKLWLAIGRIPAHSEKEVRSIVAKIKSYEQTVSQNGRSRVVVGVADGQNDSFRQAAQGFLEYFNADYTTQLIVPPHSTGRIGEEINGAINKGIYLLSYFGHGSIQLWGKDQLYTIDDVSKMNNTLFPIIVNMTCLTGFFTHPTSQSLSEAILLLEQHGAVAVISPTSLTLPTDQDFFSKPLAEALAYPGEGTIGEAFLKTQQSIPTNTTGALEVLYTYLLFGDPALRLGVISP